MNLVDKDGWNALDIAIIRINFQAAKMMTKAGMTRRSLAEYEGKTWRKYDIQMMFDGIDADTDDIPYKDFFVKIKREREEWLAKDLVVDRREAWQSWMWRQLNFEDAPLVPREELPQHLQPQASIRGKVINYINGIDPRKPTAAQQVDGQANAMNGEGDIELKQRSMNQDATTDQLEKANNVQYF